MTWNGPENKMSKPGQFSSHSPGALGPHCEDSTTPPQTGSPNWMALLSVASTDSEQLYRARNGRLSEVLCYVSRRNLDDSVPSDVFAE